MNALTNVLKSEVSRLARKELKAEIDAIRKAAAAQRSEIAALKRDMKTALAQIKRHERTLAALVPKEPEPTEKTRSTDFGPEQFAALRAKWGITQAQMAKVVGASPLSIYKWESGKVQPRAAQLERIQAVRGLGKRAVLAML